MDDLRRPKADYWHVAVIGVHHQMTSHIISLTRRLIPKIYDDYLLVEGLKDDPTRHYCTSPLSVSFEPALFLASTPHSSQPDVLASFTTADHLICHLYDSLYRPR